jgi:DNA replication and repair protein RecF
MMAFQPFAVRIRSLHLQQFRNHPELFLEFPEGSVQLLVGPNGSGKTNILEAAAVLAFTKSFLGVDDEHLRTWGTDFYRVTGEVQNDAGENRELQVVSQILPRRQKACFNNGVRTAMTGLIGELPVVLFLPQDLSLFSGAPAERRRYLDQILSQVSPEYFAALLEYQKILRQRNALLKAIRDGQAAGDSLEPWDLQLSDRGSLLTQRRLELMETFNLSLPDEIRSLGETWAEICIDYARKGEERTREGIRRELLEMLRANREREVIIQSTIAGPHRDDWRLMVEGRPVESFASRGQQRVAVLAMLFLEASYLELCRSEKPVILLDDIFSELDDAHRARVSDAFKDHQVLMTATNIPPGSEGATVWEVRAGKAERVTAAA